MWYLISDNDNRVIYLTPQNKEIVVGRSNDPTVCNFPIIEDASISRRHAVISLSASGPVLQDFSSRYGTFVNDAIENKTALSSEEKVVLKESDIVKFGKLQSTFTLQKMDFITCSSTLKGENLETLKKCVDKLGGMWKNEWDDQCKYLTMPAITLTIKVVLALVQGSHIVSADYWNKCVEAVDKQTKLPDPKQFTPQLIETTLNTENVSFLPDDKRKLIFKNKTFVFFSRRQFEMYKAVIVKGSGKALLLSESKLTKSSLCADDVIVVQYSVSNMKQETQTQRNQISEIVSYLKSNGRRVVSDSEIGLAVLYASLTKHCNPTFSISSEVINKNLDSSAVTKPNVLAKETQEIEGNKVIDKVIINESLTSANDISDTSHEVTMEDITNKRKLPTEDDTDSSAAKRRAVGNTSETNNDSQELFNFIEDTKQSDEQKLKFSKPQKRKVSTTGDDEDDLFNFIPEQKDSKASGTLKSSRDISTNDSTDREDIESKPKKPRLEQIPEYKPIRGIKAKELLDNTASWKSAIDIKTEIKQEVADHETDDLQNKMNSLDLGATIIMIREDLIKTERDPVVVQNVNGFAKNFKKFKKVWPVRMNITVAPSQDIESQVY